MGVNKDYVERVIQFCRCPKYLSELQQLRMVGESWDGLDVLDVGGGIGVAAAAMVAWGANVWMVDSSLDMLDYACLQKGIKVEFGEAECLPYDNGQFDRVTMIHALGHFDNMARALAEAWRVLKPGGQIMILSPNRLYDYWMKPLNWLGIVSYQSDPTMKRYLTMWGLRHALRKHGFVAVWGECFGQWPDLLWWKQGGLGQCWLERLLMVGEK